MTMMSNGVLEPSCFSATILFVIVVVIMIMMMMMVVVMIMVMMLAKVTICWRQAQDFSKFSCIPLRVYSIHSCCSGVFGDIQVFNIIDPMLDPALCEEGKGTNEACEQ